jgi:2-(1,2-epoxy-1,2-dihydrophenyl)acetyl-CoA isomerase
MDRLLAARRSFARGLLLSSDDEDLEQQMKHESASIVQMSRSHDGLAGVKAFKDKVEPSFTGS